MNNHLKVNDTKLRRNSYQLAILTSKQDRLEHLCSNSSSITSIIDHINTTRSLCTMSDAYTSRIHDYIQRSTSQPIELSVDNDILLENATYLLDSPVHALHKSHKMSSSVNDGLIPNLSLNEQNDSLTASSQISTGSVYRILFFRLFAFVLVLSCLFSIEVLQTSIYSMLQSFQILLSLNLSSSIIAFILSVYSSNKHFNRSHWKISDILAYDRCAQIMIIFMTIFTSTWIIMQYFHLFYYCVMISAIITGICFSFMIVKTFDYLLHLLTTLPIENIKIRIERINLIILVYNAICNLALTIGGGCLLTVILLQQSKNNYVIIGFKSCLSIPCSQFTYQQDNNKQVVDLTIQPTLVNLTMYLADKKQGKDYF